MRGKTDFSHLRERAHEREQIVSESAQDAPISPVTTPPEGSAYQRDPEVDPILERPADMQSDGTILSEAIEDAGDPPEDGRLIILIAEDGTQVPARFKKTRRFAHGKWWPWDKWIDQTTGQEVPFTYARWREWPY